MELMDSLGLRAMVNLDAGYGGAVSLEECLRLLKEPLPRALYPFHTLNWKRVEEGEGFGSGWRPTCVRPVRAGPRA